MLSAVAALLSLGACSKPVEPGVLGHWRAERVTVFSAKLPVGPDLVIGEHRITSPGMDAELPVSGIERKGDETTIDLQYGVGLTFYFDGPDRMYLNVPVLGKVYYRRVADAPDAPGTQAAASHGQAAQMQPVQAAPQVQQVQAVPPPPAATAGPIVPPAPARATPAGYGDYQMALLAAQHGSTGDALQFLSDAFKSGFRDFAQLAAAPQFASLRADVRYKALVAHYQ
ncbi:hypothetical protein [Paraburkholderia jirisanensis]